MGLERLVSIKMLCVYLWTVIVIPDVSVGSHCEDKRVCFYYLNCHSNDSCPLSMTFLVYIQIPYSSLSCDLSALKFIHSEWLIKLPCSPDVSEVARPAEIKLRILSAERVLLTFSVNLSGVPLSLAEMKHSLSFLHKKPRVIIRASQGHRRTARAGHTQGTA